MNPQEFETEITSSARKPFYLIAGGEPNALRRCVEAARKAVNPSFFQFNYRQYTLEEINKVGWPHLGMEASANPFGSPPRVIVIRLNESEKLLTEAQGVLTTIKKSKNPNVTVVVALDAPPDARLKFFKDLAKENCEVDCRAPTKGALVTWLINQFKDRGCKLSSTGANAMIDRIGAHPGLLLGEVEKLSLYPGPSVTLNVEQIQELVPFGPTAEIFELGMPVGAGNLNEAVPTLLELLENISPLPLVYALDTHFRRLTHLKTLLLDTANNFTNAELATQLGTSPFFLPRLLPQIKLWSLESLKQALLAIETANVGLVTSRADPKIIIEELVIKLCLMTQKDIGHS
jgi:DNA polymerase-3 subunit delta